MKLFHGSNQPIQCIDLTREKKKKDSRQSLYYVMLMVSPLGKKHKDFGPGFYATHIREQAVYWSNRIYRRYGGTATVSEFFFDKDAAINDGLNIKVFERPDREWALFVLANRYQSGESATYDYDIVFGPSVDDDMARLFALYDLKTISLDEVVKDLEEMEFHPLYFFATERSLKYISKQ